MDIFVAAAFAGQTKIPQNAVYWRNVNEFLCIFMRLPIIPKQKFTARKFNIAPERWWLEDYFAIGKVTFEGLC